MSDNRVYIYDSTLRDGAQTQGVDFTTADKLAISKELDKLGVDYIEGGWPGANHTDDEFFSNLPKLSKSKFASFGMTRRGNIKTQDDKGYLNLLQTDAKIVTLVGKTWDFHVTVALKITLEENIKMIKESIDYAIDKMQEVIFDAEHFFDGYKANKEFAIKCIKTAYDAGARWIVLCDTNGGTMPDEIEKIVKEICDIIPGKNIGIHCHNDTGNAVANSLAAVRAGARQIQGTINGLGERCGNANLIQVIPNLMLKMGYKTSIGIEELKNIKKTSIAIAERLGKTPDIHAPYVGDAAFAHKGGLHVSAVEKDPKSYEHVPPENVGNKRQILVSDQAGRANVISSLKACGIDIDPKDEVIGKLLEEVKKRELKGLTYDGAGASFELLAKGTLGKIPEFFSLHSFRVIDERRYNAKGDLITISEATVRLYVDGKYFIEAAEGNGPVDALADGLRKVLVPFYPKLKELKLVDYKVRIIAADRGTAAITRVMIESEDKNGNRWTTVGVSHDIIDASYNALQDSIVYMLLND